MLVYDGHTTSWNVAVDNNHLYADGKGDTSDLTFHRVRAGLIDELVKYIQWRDKFGVIKGISTPMVGLRMRMRMTVCGLRQRCHRRFCKMSKDPSKIFLVDHEIVTVGKVDCVSWTDESSRAAAVAKLAADKEQAQNRATAAFARHRRRRVAPATRWPTRRYSW